MHVQVHNMHCSMLWCFGLPLSFSISLHMQCMLFSQVVLNENMYFLLCVSYSVVSHRIAYSVCVCLCLFIYQPTNIRTVHLKKQSQTVCAIVDTVFCCAKRLEPLLLLFFCFRLFIFAFFSILLFACVSFVCVFGLLNTWCVVYWRGIWSEKWTGAPRCRTFCHLKWWVNQVAAGGGAMDSDRARVAARRRRHRHSRRRRNGTAFG